jgi:cytochrome c-type protein NapC
MMERLRRYWRIIRRPSVHYSLGFLTVGGFIGGIVFWVGFNTALEAANTETFCTGCHEMRENVRGAQAPSTTRTGPACAKCADCHVPHSWTNKIARKMQASKEVWGKLLGSIDTREKFVDKRLELAQHEWERLKANDSLECRNCHNYDSMDITRQSVRAQNMHTTYLASREKTCIDCHKGIAHRLPHIPAGQVVADTPGQIVPRDVGESPGPSASGAAR